MPWVFNLWEVLASSWNVARKRIDVRGGFFAERSIWAWHQDVRKMRFTSYLLHISSSISFQKSFYLLGSILSTTWRLPHLEQRRFNGSTNDTNDRGFTNDQHHGESIDKPSRGACSSSQIQVMWLKQCHKPPMTGNGLLPTGMAYCWVKPTLYPISQTTIWDG